MLDDFTPKSLYAYGKTAAAVKACIPDGLVQSLPRLSDIHGSLAVEFWYYHVNAFHPIYELKPLFYLALDPWWGNVLSFEAYTPKAEFPPSFLDMILFDEENAREIKYLEFACALLNQGGASEEDLTHAHALWLDAQCGCAFLWLLLNTGITKEVIDDLMRPNLDDAPRHLPTLWKRMLFLALEDDDLKALAWQRLNSCFRTDKDAFYRLEDTIPPWGTRTEGYR